MGSVKPASIFKFATLVLLTGISLSTFARQTQNSVEVGEYFTYSEKGETVVRQIVGHITTAKQDMFYLNTGEGIRVDDFFEKRPIPLSCDKVPDQYFVRTYVDKEFAKPQVSVHAISCRLIDLNTEGLAGVQLVDGTVVSVKDMAGTRTVPAILLAEYLKKIKGSHSIFLDAAASRALPPPPDCSDLLLR